MTARLILAIVSLILEEAAIAVIVLMGLPRLGINLPLPALIAVMVLWLVYAVVTYRIGSSALRRKPLVSLPDMLGGRGKVVRLLAPEGLVRIKGELWVAKSAGKQIDVGKEIIVVEQDGLKLVVRENHPSGG
ncbi:MAG: NfeD family protein [Dehalococcoidia bacterium]|nr:MAG: NfeD family protein [Dehalococcoidia bacterium]